MYLSQVVESGTSARGVRPASRIRTPARCWRRCWCPTRQRRRNLSDRGERLEGEIPSPIDLPKGCYLASRCPYVRDRCRAEPQELRRRGTRGHRVRCWRDRRGRPDRGRGRARTTGTRPAGRGRSHVGRAGRRCGGEMTTLHVLVGAPGVAGRGNVAAITHQTRELARRARRTGSRGRSPRRARTAPLCRGRIERTAWRSRENRPGSERGRRVSAAWDASTRTSAIGRVGPSTQFTRRRNRGGSRIGDE